MNWSTLFSLQGHGPFILGAYGLTFAALGIEVFVLWRRARRRARVQTRSAINDD